MRDELVRTIKAYNESAVDYTNSIAKLENYEDSYEFFASCLKHNDSILDLACGPANVSLSLLKRKQLKVTGVDLSPKMIEIAEKAIPEGKFFCSNIVDFKSEETFDAVVIGFAIPYLNKTEIKKLLKNTYKNMNNGAYLYLSFMDGDSEGVEAPSFNPDVEFYIYYHQQKKIRKYLKELNFKILKQWDLEYFEIDGKITSDIVFVAKLEKDY